MLNVLLIAKGYATSAEKELNEKYKNLFTGAKKHEKPGKNETVNQ